MALWGFRHLNHIFNMKVKIFHLFCQDYLQQGYDFKINRKFNRGVLFCVDIPVISIIQRGSQWQSGNTLASHL